MREEDLTKHVDTKDMWGEDRVLMAENGAWVIRRPG